MAHEAAGAGKTGATSVFQVHVFYWEFHQEVGQGVSMSTVFSWSIVFEF